MLLIEVEEVVDEIGGANVGGSKPAQVPVIFDEPHDAAELVLLVRNISGLCIWRSDEHRHAKAQTALGIEERWPDVIVEAAPIIPDDDDRGRLPLRALADSIDDACDPRLAGIGLVARMI